MNRVAPVLIAVVGVLAGCGGTTADVVKPPASPPVTSASPSPSPTLTASASPGGQHITATPATGLRTGQKVLVTGTGFSPGESLVVTQCAVKGTRTGAGDCNLNAMTPVTADTAGNVRVDFTVAKGPFGANKIVCGPAQACLISVTQATLSPSEEADVRISFR